MDFDDPWDHVKDTKEIIGPFIKGIFTLVLTGLIVTLSIRIGIYLEIPWYELVNWLIFIGLTAGIVIFILVNLFEIKRIWILCAGSVIIIIFTYWLQYFP